MRGEDGEAALTGPIAEQAVAHFPRPLLDRSLGLLVPRRGEDRVRNAQAPTDPRHPLGFVETVRTQRVIDGRGFDPARPRFGHEKEQSEAVGTARDRNAEPRVRRDERVKVTAEAVDRTHPSPSA